MVKIGENHVWVCVFFDLDCDCGAAPNLWLHGDWIWIEPNKMKEYEGIEQREKGWILGVFINGYPPVN